MTSRPMPPELVVRLATAAVGLPLLFAVVWVGGYWLAAVAAAAALIALSEFMTLIDASGRQPLRYGGIAWGAALVIVAAVDGRAVMLTLAFGASSALAAAIAVRRSRAAVRDWALTAAGPLYIGLPLAAVVLMRNGEGGIEWVALAFLATFATDTSAYAVGRLVGRRRMAPSISPGKTWEGAAGGLLGGIGATIGLVAVLDGIATAYPEAAALGVVIGVAAQAGDLLESKLKRLAGVKDSGKLIPGHGGLLDRLDSLVAVFPVVYFAARFWPEG